MTLNDKKSPDTGIIEIAFRAEACFSTLTAGFVQQVLIINN
jgi:hypothetical protein